MQEISIISADSAGFNPTTITEDDEILKSQLLKQVAVTTFKESAISLTFAAVTCFFVTTPGGVCLLVGATITMLAINALARSAAANAAYQLHLLEKEPNDEDIEIDKQNYRLILKFFSYFCGTSFSMIDLTTRDLLTHEMGHLVAAEMLYQNARAQITVDPFIGGATSFYASKLSQLGQMLGAKNCQRIVSVAGAGASFFFAMINLIASHELSESHPEMSKYLLVMALMSIFQSITYAATCFLSSYQSMAGHDFANLWSLGVHPLAAIATMIVLPIAVKTALFAFDYLKAKSVFLN